MIERSDVLATSDIVRTVRNAIWLLFGPSGVGKSEFAKYLQRRKNWLWLEIDQFKSVNDPVPDGIEVHNLRGPWNQFYDRFDVAPLAAELKRRARVQRKSGCVVSFPSRVPLQAEHMAKDVALWILYASAAECIQSFLQREQESGRNLDLAFWLANNYDAYLTFSMPDFAARRVSMFCANGKRRSFHGVFAELQAGS